jgi:hypothetical protein
MGPVMASRSPAAIDDIDGPEFIPSEQVADTGRLVLSRHGGSDGIRRLWETARAIRDGEVKVAWLFNAKPFDELNEEKSHDAAGKCIKAPGLWHDLTGIDVAIWIRQYFWNQWDPHIREAAVLHELLHVEVRRDKHDQAKVSVRKHDVEDFVAVVREYGPIFGYAEGGTPALVRAALDYERGAKRETRAPARRDNVVTLDQATRERIDRDLDATGRAKVRGLGREDDAVAALRELAGDSGTDITLTAHGRSATIHGRPAELHDMPEAEPLACVGSNHVPGHSPGCPDYVDQGGTSS